MLFLRLLFSGPISPVLALSFAWLQQINSALNTKYEFRPLRRNRALKFSLWFGCDGPLSLTITLLQILNSNRDLTFRITATVLFSFSVVVRIVLHFGNWKFNYRKGSGGRLWLLKFQNTNRASACSCPLSREWIPVCNGVTHNLRWHSFPTNFVFCTTFVDEIGQSAL